MAGDLRDVRTRLAALSEAHASWSVRLEDEFAALRTRITFAFQGQMRQVVRDAQDELERIDPGDDWPEFSGRIQERTAATVRGAFLAATDGAADVQSMIARLLADEEIGLDSTGVPISFDPQTLWQGGPSFDGRTRSGLIASIGVHGASVGRDAGPGTPGAAIAGQPSWVPRPRSAGRAERATASVGGQAAAGPDVPGRVRGGGPLRG
jgi:hypothetical protein